MSTEKMQKVRIIFEEIKKLKGFDKDTELAAWLGVKKQTLSAWEARGRIADYKPFTERGLSEEWLRTGYGEMQSSDDGKIKITELAQRLGLKSEDVLSRLRDILNQPKVDQVEASVNSSVPGVLGSIRPLEAFDVPISSRRVPVISWAQAGANGFYVDSHVVGSGFTDISCPYDVTDITAYALEIAGDSMSPKYEAGDYVIVSPARGVQTGNDAIVKLRDGQVLAKRIKEKNGHFILSSLNPDYEDITCQNEDVLFMHRIVWVKPRG